MANQEPMEAVDTIHLQTKTEEERKKSLLSDVMS